MKGVEARRRGGPGPMETPMRANDRTEIPAMIAQLRRVMAELRNLDGKIPA